MQPARRLLLIRHGRSSHVHAGWIDCHGFRAWRAAYEAAGIGDDEEPAAELARLASAADLVLSSDAQRAVASARRLAPGREPITSPLLGELELEPPVLGRVRLPLAAWAVAVGARVAIQSVTGKHPSAAEAARVEAAAAWLGELACQHGTIVAVTHASFRRLLSRGLIRLGWSHEPGPRTVRHWSAWRFRRAVAGAGAARSAVE